MPITINLDGVESWKGAAVLSPPGPHRCQCIEAGEGRSAGGHYELVLTWEATEGPQEGGQIRDWVQVTDTTLGKVRQLLEAVNLDVPAGEFELSPGPIKGRSADLLLRDRPKPDGTPRTEVAAYRRPEARSDLPGARPGEFQHPPAAVGARNDDPPPF